MNVVGTPEKSDPAAAISDDYCGDRSSLSLEEHEQQQREWRAELDQIEDEISTLRSVLAAKMRMSSELKRKLGITTWKEISDDVNQGLKNVKDSTVYQKTTSLIGGITGGISNKLGQIRHSESFKSIEEKASTAIENVKIKVASRSSSQQSLNEDAAKSRTGSIVTSPTIAEDKSLS